MLTLRGIHVQSSTGRTFSYWVGYGMLNSGGALFTVAISEPSRGIFGSLERGSTFEGVVHGGPDFAPVELAIRARVLGHIEFTDFGEWRPPPPNWIGWYGPI